jgi:hypothetical protein
MQGVQSLGPWSLVLLLVTQNAIVPAGRDCVRFLTAQLSSGRSFSAPLQHALELRITSSAGGWQIAVGPKDDPTADYLAPISPPYRAALHLRIGAGYGLTAADSLDITPRELRFVLSRRDAQLAWDIASAALLGDMQRWKDMAKLTTGTLTLRISDSRLDGDAVDWVTLAGEACVPVK